MRNGPLYDTHTAVTSTYHHGPSSHTGTIAYTYELSKGVRRRKHSPPWAYLPHFPRLQSLPRRAARIEIEKRRDEVNV